MQINRLLEIVYILFDKKIVTAQELAEHFEVSARTIYRDVDVLSTAGIPVYASKGRNGGISLLDNFVIKKSMITEKEQIDILSSLHGMQALNVPDAEPVLQKLAAMFERDPASWIEVDFSYWGSSKAEQEKFNLLKMAVVNKKRIQFDYYSGSGERTLRSVEPLKLLFKGQAWYVYGFCTERNDYRMFRVTRIRNPVSTEETFCREIPTDVREKSMDETGKRFQITLHISPDMAFRVYDEFGPEFITRREDGSYLVTTEMTEGEWVFGYLLSFGEHVEVLSPQWLRETIKRRLENNLKKYL